MNKIKTPVRYDGGADFSGNPCIRDADGRHICEISAWQFNWPAQGGKDTDEITPEYGHAVGNQIAKALNGNDERVAQLEAEVAAGKDKVMLPRHQIDSLREGLRLSMNYFHSHKKETALDRLLCRNWEIIEQAFAAINGTEAK